jgi:DNA (cytosine-5)-methyltransferase 1
VKVLYNEYDKFAAAWLRALAEAGHISKGEINERSISDIKGPDTAGFIRAHFFAGIGGWEEALRIAGWPSDIPVWTGSCPCQPFSAAGKRKGTADARHLWPEFLRLIAECRPKHVFGEQVASKDGRLWLAGVRADLEALGYAVGAADLCAAGIGAPHIRQRLYWVAYAQRQQEHQEQQRPEENEGWGGADSIGGRGVVGGLEHAQGNGREPRRAEPGRGSIAGRCGWDDSIWTPCRDGKARRIKSGLEPLAHGIPGRVVRLRGYGNAIVPALAAEFIQAVMEILRIERRRP